MSNNITDHAVIRYLERVLHIDIEKIKSEIVCKKTLEKMALLKQLKAFHIRKNNCILRVVNGKVVTVLNKKGKR
jgi:hypothetical protein